MKKNIFIIIVLLLISSCILAKSNDDKEALDKINKKLELLSNKIESLKKVNKGDLILKLQEEIDLLKTEIEKLKIDLLDNNPYATGKTLNWGKGINLWIGYAPDNQTSLEVGYVFNILKVAGKKNTSHKNKNLRLGIGIGVTSFSNERIFTNGEKTEDDINYSSTGIIYYSKISASSPVLLTFINYTIGIKLMFIDPSVNGMNITRNRFGFGIDFDINFWFTKKMCWTIGYKTDFEFRKTNTLIGTFPDKIISDNFKVQLGTKYFF